jgi:nicotinamide-nucleotide amidase
MSTFTVSLLQTAEQLLQHLREKKFTLATAESCTGGLVSALLTEISGSSDVFSHGFITYANAAKISMLGVEESLIQTHGAVSEQVACAMAQGALRVAEADVSIAITGIAGPSGATKNKPVGLVHIACVRAGFTTLHSVHHFAGDRSAVRLQAVAAALELVQRQLVA